MQAQSENTTFQAIDNQFLISTIYASAKANGLELTTRPSYKGVQSFSYGDIITGPDGSKMQPQLFLRNINDGGHALMIGVGVYRFVCANGLVVGDDFFSRRIIHRKGQTLDNFLIHLEKDLTDAFRIAADYYMEKLTELFNTKISDHTAVQIIGSLSLPTGVIDSAIYSWAKPRVEDQGSNLFSLYNIVNEANRRRCNSTQAFDKELGLLQHIEALYAHELVYGKVG